MMSLILDSCEARETQISMHRIVRISVGVKLSASVHDECDT